MALVFDMLDLPTDCATVAARGRVARPAGAELLSVYFFRTEPKKWNLFL